MDRVRYCGEPVAAVVAESEEIAEQALSLMHVVYQPLEVLCDAVEACRPEAPPACIRIWHPMRHRTLFFPNLAPIFPIILKFAKETPQRTAVAMCRL